MKISLGISTCPNDTFAFHGLLTGAVTIPGIEFDIQLMDVQELNERLFRGEFMVAKASFHAALLLADRYGVLSCGSALGFGVGPLLLAALPHSSPPPIEDGEARLESEIDWQSVVLCPGKWTTATLLYRLFYPRQGALRQVVFSEIMPALQERRAGFGVCIHEGRFTWQEQGLSLVEDLGTRWETVTGQPLPLGGILIRLDLEKEMQQQVHRAIADSIQYGLSYRQETLSTMRKYAQEFSDEVLFQHVDLYVNRWTVELGEQGELALRELYHRGVAAGVVLEGSDPLQVVRGEGQAGE
jgi:1,4-dihydroxy-6-naphthoate synthase